MKNINYLALLLLLGCRPGTSDNPAYTDYPPEYEDPVHEPSDKKEPEHSEDDTPPESKSNDEDPDAEEGEDVTTGIVVGGGNWETKCLPSNEQFKIETFFIKEEKLNRVTNFYPTENCLSSLFEIREVSTAEEILLFDEQTGFHTIDYKIESVTLLPLAKAKSFNEKELCGINDWQNFTTNEVSGLQCGDLSFPQSGSVLKNIMEIEPDTLVIRFGERSDSNERPKELGENSFEPKHI